MPDYSKHATGLLASDPLTVSNEVVIHGLLPPLRIYLTVRLISVFWAAAINHLLSCRVSTNVAVVCRGLGVRVSPSNSMLT